jgi:K+-sensing histidine kinase KdpD
MRANIKAVLLAGACVVTLSDLASAQSIMLPPESANVQATQQLASPQQPTVSHRVRAVARAAGQRQAQAGSGVETQKPIR